MYAALMVPLDGSRFAERALGPATRIARQTNAKLHLVAVHEPSPAAGLTDVHSERVEKLVRDRLGQYLEEAARHTATEDGVEAETHLVSGRAAEALATFRAAHGVDLIVMTTHGHGGPTRSWLGSVADRVVRTTHVPVLLLRLDAEAGADAARPNEFRRVFIPLDGSSLAEQVLPHATRLGDLSEAAYVLFTAVPPRYAARSPFLPHAVAIDRERSEAQAAAARSYLGEVAADLRRRQARNVEIRVEQGGDIARTVLAGIRELEPDLVAIATHGRGGLGRALLGSVADKVLRGASVPVLLVRQRQA